MHTQGSWRVRGLLLLAVAGCSHSSGAGREQFSGAWTAEDSGVRTKGGDSATLHIQALIARGQLQEAEAYLVQAVAAGLVAREAATRLQEKIAERKQPNADQDRRVPRGNLQDWEIEEPQRRTCATEMPTYPICRALPEEYVFHGARQALEAMKQRLGAKSLGLHNNEEPTQSGPCPRVGTHYNVRVNGKRAGSIVCCPCCVENEPDPLKWEKCRIVW